MSVTYKRDYVRPDIDRAVLHSGNVLHQCYELAFGRIADGIFYRSSGFGAHLGDGAPMLLVVATLPAKRLGRPKGRKPQPFRHGRAPSTPAVAVHYAMDWEGYFWSIRESADGTARARTLDSVPRGKLGGLKRFGHLKDVQRRAIRDLAAARATWQAQQDAAHIAQLRQRCPLV